ncbi:DNA/RNA helicase domain-containing protein [Cellulomonas soli]
MFTGQRRADLHDWLRSRLAPDSGVRAADDLLGSHVAPSRQLLTVAAQEVREREQFVLLDEQRVAHELVLSEVRRAREADTKTVVVIAGGPGSGKSVIALSLLGDLAREGRTVMHATGSRSFTQTLRQVAGKGSSRTKSLFAYFNSFMTAEKNGLDVLILDEAHRLRLTSVNRYTRKEVRAVARPQVDELFDAARVPVFLLDQFQVVRPGEMGSVAEIEAHAAARGLQVCQINLQAQFRSGGSDAYLDWVLRLLGLRDGGPVEWRDEPTFTVEVAESPEAMTARLEAQISQGMNARITAGYCWPWSDPRSDGTLVDDVVIGDWHRPWNVRGERGVPGAPPSALWATVEGGFGQVGCVYTAQGFEYSWNGVILGPDLVWRDDRWVARREHNKDPDFRSRKAVDDATFDRLVRHVYKVLLTRGMAGTLLYSVDPETQDRLRQLVNPAG